MKSKFLDGAKQGKSDGWRYLLGFLLALGSWLLGSYLIEVGIGAGLAGQSVIDMNGIDSSLPKGQISHLWYTPEDIIYMLRNIPFLLLWAGLFGAVRGLHRRSFRTLVTPTQSINFHLLIASFSVFFLLATSQTLIEYFLQPQAFRWSFYPVRWLLFLPIALLLTPLQTSAEELLFRGYLLQGLGLIVRQPLLLTIAASLPFALIHFANSEMERQPVWIGLTYFALAVFLTVITLKSDRLELALGVHAANNLFIVLFVNSADSTLQTPAIITQIIPTDPRITFVATLIVMAVFYLVFFGKPQKIE